MNKYIKDLGINEENTPWGWDINDKRKKEQCDAYGFDERETWALNLTFAMWLYSRVSMFKEKASKIIKLDYHKFTIDDKEYTQIEMIDLILENTESYLKSSDNNDDKLVKATELFAKILPAMWW